MAEVQSFSETVGSAIARREFLAAGGAAAAAIALATPLSAASAEIGPRSRIGTPHLGTCYYPEQWPESWWAEDAAEMVARGISRVRIAEFGWTLLEPEAGRYDWRWLDRAISTLAKAGLGIVLGTPTATPPKWMIDLYPEILPYDIAGHPRNFGSRRYYTPSSARYIAECKRIAGAMAERYGAHPAVIGWQIDNEYGCHSTTVSYGPVDTAAFKLWLRRRYRTIDALNAAWGTVVWSQELGDFDQVTMPSITPYDPLPGKLIDVRRFASDQIVNFQQAQAEVIKPRSPGRFITTNMMTNFTDFDHYALGDTLSFATWDSYPTGGDASSADPRWERTGPPDTAAFNHDLMRAINPTPFWVMEQQAGPVNWAAANVVPDPGMVRLWTWEAFAHGADTVSYFSWRQAPVGPEQMMSGLEAQDRSISVGGKEAMRVAAEIARLGPLPETRPAKVAIVYDYESSWMASINPHGQGQDHLAHVLSWYSAARALGLDIDIVRPGAPIDAYKVVLVPALWAMDAATVEVFAKTKAVVVFGPRTGSKTKEFAVPDHLAPGLLQKLLPLRVTQVESMAPARSIPIRGIDGAAIGWREWIETALSSAATFPDGSPAILRNKNYWYVACRGNDLFTSALIRNAIEAAGLEHTSLPNGVRLRRRGSMTFAFNYGETPWVMPESRRNFLIGSSTVDSHDVACWT